MSMRDPEICSCSALRQAARHATRLYDAALAPAGLGLNQFSILARLDRLGPLRLKDLAERLVMDRSTLGHLVRPLAARGLIVLRVDLHDRRATLLELTGRGEEITARAREMWARAESGFGDAFGPGEAAELRLFLKRVESVEFASRPS